MTPEAALMLLELCLLRCNVIIYLHCKA